MYFLSYYNLNVTSSVQHAIQLLLFISKEVCLRYLPTQQLEIISFEQREINTFTYTLESCARAHVFIKIPKLL